LHKLIRLTDLLGVDQDYFRRLIVFEHLHEVGNRNVGLVSSAYKHRCADAFLDQAIGNHARERTRLRENSYGAFLQLVRHRTERRVETIARYDQSLAVRSDHAEGSVLQDSLQIPLIFDARIARLLESGCNGENATNFVYCALSKCVGNM